VLNGAFRNEYYFACPSFFRTKRLLEGFKTQVSLLKPFKVGNSWKRFFIDRDGSLLNICRSTCYTSTGYLLGSNNLIIIYKKTKTWHFGLNMTCPEKNNCLTLFW
jgi:hypothetical protein